MAIGNQGNYCYVVLKATEQKPQLATWGAEN